MSKTSASAPVALHDFAKSNGAPRSSHDVYNDEPSMTRGEFQDECDINTIMKQYDRFLADPTRSIREPFYYDFSEMPDTLMGTMAVIKQGETAFMSLPAVVRKEFDNDALLFMDFAADPANVDQMRTWGLAPPEKVPEPPMRVQVVPETAPADGSPPPASK